MSNSIPVIGPKECKIMISYAHSDREDAEKLANFLTGNGHPTFCTCLYCGGMAGSWRGYAIQGIKSCEYYVMLLSNGWQKSKQCQFETKIAVDRYTKGLLIPIPVWYDDFDDDVDEEDSFYRIQFQSIQAVYRKYSVDWMKVVLQLLGGEVEVKEKQVDVRKRQVEVEKKQIEVERKRVEVKKNETGPSYLEEDEKKLVLISCRFDGGQKENEARALYEALRAKGAHYVKMVYARAGDDYGEQTLKYLYRSKVMIAFCFEDYGEYTGNTYNTYSELKYANERRKEILPIKRCKMWPPEPPGPELGRALTSKVFGISRKYLDWSNKKWDANACADEVLESIIPLLKETRKASVSSTPTES